MAVASVASADIVAAIEEACCQLEHLLGASAEPTAQAEAEAAEATAEAAVAAEVEVEAAAEAADEDPLLVLAFGEVATDPAALARALRARLGDHARLVGCSTAPAGAASLAPAEPAEQPRLTLFGMRCARRCGVGMAEGAAVDAFAAAAAAARAAIAPLHVRGPRSSNPRPAGREQPVLPTCTHAFAPLA